MLSHDFKENLKDSFEGSRIVRENKKISIEMFADTVVTIEDFEELTKDGEKFYAVTTKDNPGKYFFSGKSLTEIINACVEAGEDIRGESIYIGAKIRTKSGKTFTPVKLM